MHLKSLHQDVEVFYYFETMNVKLDDAELELEYQRKKKNSSYAVKTS